MLKTKRIGRSFIVFIGLLSLVALLSIPARAADKAPIKIGVTLPLSGPLAVNAQNYLRAMKLAVKKINAEGGILKGTNVELVVYDDKGVPEEAVSTIKKLIQRDKVNVCVTGAISPPALAQKEVTREAKMLHIIITAQHKNITLEGHPYLFRLNTTVEMGSDALCKYVMEKLKPKTVWYLGINDDYGRDVGKRYQTNLSQTNFVGFEYYNRDDTDFMIYLTKGKALKPDLFMMAAPSDAIAATIMKQKKQLGFTGIMSQAAGVLTPTNIGLAGDAAEGVYSADSWVRTLKNPVNQWFVENYEKEFNAPAGKQEANAYESILFPCQAIDKAGTATNSEKIANIFRTTTFQGARGKITFDKIGQAMATDYPVVVKNKALILAE